MKGSGTTRSTVTLMAFTAISRILGFVRQAVVNAIFGATGNADVLNAVFIIPNNLRKLMAEGALSSAFVPVISQAIHDEDPRSSGAPADLTRRLVAFQILVLLPVLLLSTIFSGAVTGFILDFPDFAQQELAASLFQWLIHYTLLISISAVLMGALHAAGRFTVPAVTPILFSVTVIASIFLFSRAHGIYAVAFGVLIGGVAQILFQYPQFRSQGFGLAPVFSFRDARFRRVIRGWLPVVAASSIFAVNQQVALFFASGLESGSSSAIANATIFWQLPQGIFAVSVTTVLFPRMSREAGKGDIGALRTSVDRGLRGISGLLIPSSILLAAFAPEVIAVAFQRGEFGLADTQRTAIVLICYCAGMVSVSAYTFLQRFFYARGEFATPIATAGLVLLINTAASLWLKETLGAAGLALANACAFTVGGIVQLGVAANRLKGFNMRGILETTLKATLASLPGLGVIIGAKALSPQWWVTGSTLPNLLRFFAVGGLAVALTAAALVLLRVEMSDQIRKRIKRG